jgi:hypothetical protein
MTIHMHVLKVKRMNLEPSENDTFVGYRVFHMETNSEEPMAPPVVRQVAPPSTNSEGARVQREPSLRIK